MNKYITMKKNDNNEVADLLSEIKSSQKFTSFKEASETMLKASKPLSTPGADEIRGEKVFSSSDVKDVQVITEGNHKTIIMIPTKKIVEVCEKGFTHILNFIDRKKIKVSCKNYGWALRFDNEDRQTFIRFGNNGGWYRLEKQYQGDNISHIFARRKDKESNMESMEITERLQRAFDFKK